MKMKLPCFVSPCVEYSESPKEHHTPDEHNIWSGVRPAQATSPLGYIAIRLEHHQGHSARSPVAHFDVFVYSTQVTLPEESDQLRLHRHSATSPFGLNATKATAPGAQLLTLTSSSTLHRPRCLRSQTSSGYIAIRLESHQGHSARSPVTHIDELFPSVNMDKLYSTIHIDELFPSVHMDELFTLTSSSQQFARTSSTQQFTLTSSSCNIPKYTLAVFGLV